MKQSLTGLFREHPTSVGETYLQHLTVALGYSVRLFTAALAALVHGFLPFVFKATASRTIEQMHNEIAARKARPAAHQPTDRALAAAGVGSVKATRQSIGRSIEVSAL